MNNAVVGLLALGGIVYYMFYKKNKNKDDTGNNELKAEDEKVVTKTVRADDDI